jgi:hypothetical protein
VRRGGALQNGFDALATHDGIKAASSATAQASAAMKPARKSPAASCRFNSRGRHERIADTSPGRADPCPGR